MYLFQQLRLLSLLVLKRIIKKPYTQTRHQNSYVPTPRRGSRDFLGVNMNTKRPLHVRQARCTIALL